MLPVLAWQSIIGSMSGALNAYTQMGGQLNTSVCLAQGRKLFEALHRYLGGNRAALYTNTTATLLTSLTLRPV